MTEIIDQLHVALAAAQAEMPNAVFNRINPHFKSKYADLAAIREATTPALTKHGLSINHETKVLESGFTMLTGILSHGESGQQQRSEWLITATAPQARGSELTYGRRYTWCCLTGIVAEEDDDANATSDDADAASQGASTETRGDRKTLTKAKGRPLYKELETEIREQTTLEGLNAWYLEALPRINQLHPDDRKWIIKECSNRKTAIEVGADEEGKTIGEEIDDEIPEPGERKP